MHSGLAISQTEPLQFKLMKKRIIFHVGATKTGSTYLQSVFSSNYQRLLDQGIDYPCPEDKHVIETGACVGNIVRMIFTEGFVSERVDGPKFPTMNSLWSKDVVNHIATNIEKSSHSTILFSSESMMYLTDEILDLLKTAVVDHHNCTFILFVRDPYDHFYSAWSQNLKAKFITTDFKTFVSNISKGNESNVGMFTPIIRYKRAGIDLTIINYDSHKLCLADAFFNFAKIPRIINLHNFSSEKRLHNRSFTESENCVQLLTNRYFPNSHFPAFVRSRLLSRQLNLDSYKMQKPYYPIVDRLIFERFWNEIENINRIINGGPLRTNIRESATEHNELSANYTDLECLFDCIKFTEKYKKKVVTLRERIRHFYRCATKSNTPFDFDPVAYLDLNPDIQKALVDPYDHFNLSGYREGRPYKYS
jgi:hypothetical protein